MTKLFTPPTWQLHTILESALRAKVTESTTVYRLSGVWHNISNPGYDNPVVANVDVDAASGLRLYFNSPTVVPDNVATDLTNNGGLVPADPSWTPGTLT